MGKLVDVMGEDMAKITLHYKFTIRRAIAKGS
jgi:hypothetical protein